MNGPQETEMNQARETTSSRFGFIMLAAGSAIGLGNVWRFPYMAGANGGGLFVLFYLLFLLLLGFPVMCMELAVGRASRRNLYGAFRDLPGKRPSLWRFPAGVFFSGNLILMIMYTTVTGWMLTYFVDFLTGRFAALSTEAELRNQFTTLLNDPGKMSVYMILTVLIGSIICAFGLRRGVERVTKILMAGLFILLSALSLYALFLPGAVTGMKFYLTPALPGDTSIFKIASGAMSQAFFTLSLGIGALEIFGSYTDKKNSLASESILIISCDTLAALLSGILVFAACFSYGIQVDGGPGLVLFSLTGIFNHLPGGRILGSVFFLFLSIAALTTIIAVFENMIAFMMDEWHFSRGKATWINFFVVGLLSLPCVLGFNLWKHIHPLGGKSTILDFEDWLISDICLPLGSLLIVFFCCRDSGWTWERFLAEVNTGKGIRFPAWLKWYAAVILPVLILYLFGLGIFNRFF